MSKRTISARIVADSITESSVVGKSRLTTFVVTFPRIVLAEFNTHRMLSRNSASSRARPIAVMLKDVEDDPFIPIRWMRSHKGMQGSEYLDEEESRAARDVWLAARDAAVVAARRLAATDVTKQIVNRLLEPFLWHEVIVTATDYENFFALRAHPDAEIHIAELAHAMLRAYNASEPVQLAAGQWHIPFGDQMDEQKLAALLEGVDDDGVKEERLQELKLEIACARCARISYKPFGSEDQYDYAADRKLFRSLVDGGHMSPLEHCARAMSGFTLGRIGNFRGFIQYRKLMDNENRHDPRVVDKTTE